MGGNFTPELKRILRDAGCCFERAGKGDHQTRGEGAGCGLRAKLLSITFLRDTGPVIPGKRSATRNPGSAWIPAFAGMTNQRWALVTRFRNLQ